MTIVGPVALPVTLFGGLSMRVVFLGSLTTDGYAAHHELLEFLLTAPCTNDCETRNSVEN